jgi:hypothetical protein
VAQRLPARAASGARWASVTALAPALILVGLLLGFFLIGLRLIDIGAGDLGIVGLFSTDEQLAGQLVQTMIRHKDLGLSHFFSYGPLDLYAGRALLWAYGLFRTVSEESIVVALRLVSLAAGAGSACLVFVLGRKLWNSWTGLIAAAMVLSSSTFLAWSTTAHPDMLQLFWLLAGLLVAAKLAGDSLATERSRRCLLLVGAACAGLAFATKYTGELLLPVLWLAAFLGRLGASNDAGMARWRTQVRATAADVVLSCAAFAASFMALDPSAIGELRAFIYQMTLEAGLAHRGHLLQVSPDPAGWVRVLGSTGVIGPAGEAAGVIALAAWIYVDLRSVLRRSSDRRPLARLPLELFTAVYLALLLVWIGDQQPRYVLPALPGLCLAAAAGIVWLAQLVRPWSLAMAAGVAVLAIAPLLPPARALAQSQLVRMRSPGVEQRIAAGDWLAANRTADTTVVADAYSYVPSSFANVTQSFGLTPGLIESVRPDIIITDASIRDRFSDPAVANHYIDGPAAYQEIASTYTRLETANLACYTTLESFGPVKIYGREREC